MTAIVRYHGGKVRLAPKIVRLLPPHLAYIEPYAGGAATLLAKPRSKLEVYNDIDGEMVHLFRMLRERGEDLARAIALTPYARDEHRLAYERTEEPLERARRTLIRSHMGHGSNGVHKSTGFRAAGLRANNLSVHAWAGLPETVRNTMERLRGVVIENRPALDLIARHDDPAAVFYVDPPYLPETRERACRYTHELTVDDHVALLDALRAVKGRVVLSGYASDLYDTALSNWRRIELKTRADGGVERVEVLWLNFEDQLPIEGAI